MSKLSKTIEAAIKKNLPEVVAGELKQFIEEAELTIALLEDTKAAQKRTQEANAELQQKVKDLTDLKHSVEENKGLMDKLESRERNLKLELALAAIESYKRETESIKDLVGKLFRNVEYRKHLSANFTESESGNQNNNWQSTCKSKNTTKDSLEAPE